MVQQQALIAAVATLDPDRLVPEERTLPKGVRDVEPADERPLAVQVATQLGVGLNPVSG